MEVINANALAEFVALHGIKEWARKLGFGSVAWHLNVRMRSFRRFGTVQNRGVTRLGPAEVLG